MARLMEAKHVTAEKTEPNGVELIASELSAGAWHEIVQHPLHLVEQASLGAGIAIGASLLAPEITKTLSEVAVGAAAIGILDNSGKWIHASARVARWEKSTPEQQRAAQTELRNIGATATDLAAGAAGGLLAFRNSSLISGRIKSTFKFGSRSNLQLPELEAGPENIPKSSLPDLWIHESAQVADTAVLGEHVSIGPNAIVGANAKIGADSVVEAHAQIGTDTELGNGVHVGAGTNIGKNVRVEAETNIGSHVEIGDESDIGPYSRIFANVHIGRKVAVGQMATLEPEVVLHPGSKIGSFSVINKRVIVGENSWLDSVTVEPDVTIGRNVHIDDNALIKGAERERGTNASHIGDGVSIGKDTHIHAKIGSGTTIGARSSIFGTVGQDATLGERVEVNAGSSVGDRVIMGKHSGVGRARDKNHVPSDTVVDAFDNYPVAPVVAEDY